MDNRDGKRPMEESPDGNMLPRIKIHNPKVKEVRYTGNADPLGCGCSGCVRNFATGNAVCSHKKVHVGPNPPAFSAAGGAPSSSAVGAPASSAGVGKVPLSSNELMPKNFITFSSNMKLVIKDSSNRTDDVAPVKVDANWSEFCSICGENFLSLKSLFDHYTQCHPEKEAVGSGSGNDGYEPKNLIDSLLVSWPVKVERSDRKLMRARDEVKQAAITLMDIYNLERKNSELKKFPSNIDSSYSLINFKNPLLNYPWIHEKEAIRKGKEPVFYENRNPSKRSPWTDQGFTDCLGNWPKMGGGGGGVAKELSFKGKASSSRLPEKSTAPMKKTLPQKLKTTGDNSSSSSLEALFTCTICYRTFTSYQALGGHRSSHSKPKNLLAINNTVGRGEALGGHKRSHWGNETQPDQEIQGSNLEGSQLKKMKYAHGFDLNTEPAGAGIEGVEAEYYCYSDQQEEEQMEEQQEEVEVQEEDGAAEGDYSYDTSSTSTPFATSSSS